MSTLTIRLPDDKHARFRAMAARGSVKKGIAVLDQLDAAFAPTPARVRQK